MEQIWSSCCMLLFSMALPRSERLKMRSIGSSRHGSDSFRFTSKVRQNQKNGSMSSQNLFVFETCFSLTLKTETLEWHVVFWRPGTIMWTNQEKTYASSVLGGRSHGIFPKMRKNDDCQIDSTSESQILIWPSMRRLSGTHWKTTFNSDSTTWYTFLGG